MKFHMSVAAALTVAVASVSYAAPFTVGALNPNLSTEGTTTGTLQNSPNGSANANFIPFATFKTQVLAAFNANTGGVMDFNETSTTAGSASFPTGTFGANGSPLAVAYGASQANSIGISRTSPIATDFLDAGTANVAYASGVSYLGFSGTTAAGLRLTPSAGRGVSAVGFTVLERGAARTLTVNFQLDDGTIVGLVGTPALAAADALGVNGPSIFYGFQAPTGRTISVINYSAPEGALRIDDLGFITTAVPEPTTLAAVAGLGGLLLRRRRSI